MRVIYKTTNLINGKIYIGKDSANRKSYLGSGKLLNFAIKKYGKGNFKKEILEICETLKILNEREIFWIGKYNSTNKEIGYNILPGGEGGNPYKNNPNLDIFLENLSKGQKNRYKEETPINKEKRISRLKGREVTQETRNKISKSNLGKNRGKEEIEKIKKALFEYFNSPKGIEQKEIQSRRQKGSKQSIESNIKRSNSMKGRALKKLAIHPSSEYWYFYNHNNELIYQSLGKYIKSLQELKTNWRKVIKFNSLEGCLNYELSEGMDYKIYHEKYYK